MAKFTKLDVRAFALAFGICFALYMALMGIGAMFGYGSQVVALLGTAYLGFAASFYGVFVGAIWGFVDGFIGGLLIALVYNTFARH